MTEFEGGAEGLPGFLERFSSFEDGVISGISIILPRGDRSSRKIVFEIQAMDREAPGQGGPHERSFEWKLVRIAMKGIEEYSLGETVQYPLQVLSDGLQIAFHDQCFLLDLDPGVDAWSPSAIRDTTSSYSKQYVISRGFSFEVEDGPFI